MARFDVYANPEPSERRHTPYLLDVQNDYIDHLETRVVVPLRSEASFGPRARDLHPLLSVKSDSVVLDVAALGAIPRSELKKHVASLKDSGESIQNALDALFGAF